MPVQTEETEDYKAKYKNLKRKMKLLIYVSIIVTRMLNLCVYSATLDSLLE